jgi:uncharacterized protein (TIGR02271 family)
MRQGSTPSVETKLTLHGTVGPPGETVARETTVVPIAEEDIAVGTAAQDVERIRVEKTVTTEEVDYDAPYGAEELVVERIPIGRPVERAPEVRVEGATTIIPIVEETVVLEKRLVLKEEVRITKHRTEGTRRLRVPRRVEHARVERTVLSQTTGRGPGKERNTT